MTPKRVGLYCVVLIITALACWIQPALSDTINTCQSCGKPITGTVLKIDSTTAFHKECFVCGLCNTPINGPFNTEGKTFYHPDCYKKHLGRVCAFCNKVLSDRWKISDGKTYHPDCYRNHVQPRCTLCGKVLDGTIAKDNDGVYHDACYRETKLDRCVVCAIPLEGTFVTDPWGNHSHESHNGVPVTLCESCGRILSANSSEGAFRYSDGRPVCGICKKQAVTRTTEVEQSRNYVMELLKGVGITGLPPTIPILLVDADTLAAKSDRDHVGNTKGFTLTSTRTTGNTTVTKHTIYILTGLPELEFSGVLAHELLHVWLLNQNIRLSRQKTEGFCNLGTMLVNTASGTPYADILQARIESDDDWVYGKGYRKMKAMLDQYGWKELLQRIR